MQQKPKEAGEVKPFVCRGQCGDQGLAPAKGGQKRRAARGQEVHGGVKLGAQHDKFFAAHLGLWPIVQRGVPDGMHRPV